MRGLHCAEVNSGRTGKFPGKAAETSAKHRLSALLEPAWFLPPQVLYNCFPELISVWRYLYAGCTLRISSQTGQVWSLV